MIDTINVALSVMAGILFLQLIPALTGAELGRKLWGRQGHVIGVVIVCLTSWIGLLALWLVSFGRRADEQPVRQGVRSSVPPEIASTAARLST